MKNELDDIRKQLLNNVSNNILVNKLDVTLKYAIEQNNLFTPILKQAINNALQDISNKKIKSAGYQIALISKIPLNDKERERWSENAFYEDGELSEYFDNTDANRIKEMIIILAELTNKLSPRK